MPEECLFCRIVGGGIPARVVRRDRGMVAFEDIAPKALVHLLFIPERHVDSLAGVTGLSPQERSDMLDFIAEVADAAGLGPTGYRVTTNHGSDALQSVHHLHWHVMGGATLSETM
jgi:histidine triad (HIT) family protein